MFRVLLWAEIAAGRPWGRPAVGPPARTHSLQSRCQCLFCGFGAQYCSVSLAVMCFRTLTQKRLMDLYTENLSLFSPGTNGHDISMRPFFEKKQGGGLRIFAAGLGTSYYESESKAARNKLLFQVIKGGNVLNLRDVIDTYPARFPKVW